MHTAIVIAGTILDVLGVAFLIAVCTGKWNTHELLYRDGTPRLRGSWPILRRRQAHVGADACATVGAYDSVADGQIHD